MEEQPRTQPIEPLTDAYLQDPEIRAEYERWMRIYNRRAERTKERAHDAEDAAYD